MESLRCEVSATHVDWVNPDAELTVEALSALRRIVEAQIGSFSDGMSGRGGVLREALEDGTKIVVRPLLRGGVLRRLNRALFFSFPWCSPEQSRVSQELRITQSLWNQGVSVPRPLGGSISWVGGGWGYRGFIVTEEIRDAENLLELGQSKDRLREFLFACRLAGLEARKMLGLHVFHSDLHVGNVLVTRGPRVWLIDFDKAREFAGNAAAESYPGKILQRWQRAIAKRNLSHEAMTEFERGLFDA